MKSAFWEHKTDREAPHACFCIGPQNGEPLCPCMMRGRAIERSKMREEILAEIEANKPKRKSYARR
jgi:hypothetical protein